jgi:hypothetical protein
MKNFNLLYQTGTSEVMNDAIWECKMNFESFWGIKLLNSLRQMHRFVSSGMPIEEIKDNPGVKTNDDHREWFISQRQKEFREEDE